MKKVRKREPNTTHTTSKESKVHANEVKFKLKKREWIYLRIVNDVLVEFFVGWTTEFKTPAHG